MNIPKGGRKSRNEQNHFKPLTDHLRGEVSDGSQPPMTFDWTLRESAGSRSLDRFRHAPCVVIP